MTSAFNSLEHAIKSNYNHIVGRRCPVFLCNANTFNALLQELPLSSFSSTDPYELVRKAQETKKLHIFGVIVSCALPDGEFFPSEGRV